MAHDLYTIGHSNHSIEAFIDLLTAHRIDALCDVRSAPYSRYNPQFNRDALRLKLLEARITYVFLGRELGARSDDPLCYVDGRVHYPQLAATQQFQRGIERVQSGMLTHRIAVMCAEKDPITCHRMILVSRHLRSDQVQIHHILSDGSLESNLQAEKRLLQALHLPEQDLYSTTQELIEQAYDLQGARIAYAALTTGNDISEGAEL